MKTKISLQWPSLLVFDSFLKLYYIEKEVEWEAQMGTGCLPVVKQAEVVFIFECIIYKQSKMLKVYHYWCHISYIDILDEDLYHGSYL